MLKDKTPQERFLYWIKEREEIRIQKEAGYMKPWTTDPIFQKYKFCNVRRMDDRVSRWLMDNWYKPNFNHKNMVLACVVARHLNKPEALEVMGFPKLWKPTKFLADLKTYQKEGGKVFNGAYIIRAAKEYKSKLDMVFLQTCKNFEDNPPTINTDSIQETTEILQQYHNIGSFMAGQISADLRWAVEGNWSDACTWAPMGPGSKRGMNRLHGRDLKYNLKQDQFLDELTAAIELVKTELSSIADRLEAIDVQNCFCEFDKYERTLFENRRPKCLYPGAE